MLDVPAKSAIADSTLSRTSPLRSLALRWGGWAALTLVLGGVVYRLLELGATAKVRYLFFVVLGTLALLAQRQLRKHARPVSFGQSLRLGLVVVTLGALAYALFIALYMSFIDPSLLPSTANEFRAHGFDMPAVFLHPAGFGLLVFLQLFVSGGIFSLIGAGLFRRR